MNVIEERAFRNMFAIKLNKYFEFIYRNSVKNKTVFTQKMVGMWIGKPIESFILKCKTLEKIKDLRMAQYLFVRVGKLALKFEHDPEGFKGVYKKNVNAFIDGNIDSMQPVNL